MKKKLGWLTAVAALCLTCDSGCRHGCQKGCSPAPRPGVVAGPPGGVFLPGGPVQQPVLPPPGFTQPAPMMQPLPGTQGPLGPPQIPPPPAPIMSGSKFEQRAEPQWLPGEVTVQLGTPQPIITDAPAQKAIPQQPQVAEATPKSNAVKTPIAPGAFPVGIPQFAQARERVSAGLRPLLDDGLDWLKEQGYRTVINLREPGIVDSADRKQVEKRGMAYVSFEVSPLKLTKKLVDDFNKVIADPAAQPVFVYDRDGALAGSVWYLHFRTTDGATGEEARGKAAGLGLREERAGLHHEMWLSARQLLEE